MRFSLYFPIVVIFMAMIVSAGCFEKNIDNHKINNEIINKTLDVEAFNAVGIPFPNGGVYEIEGGTLQRGDPSVEFGYEYDTWIYSTSTDKFGTQNTSHLQYHYVSLGTSNDNSDIDRIFKLPDGAVNVDISVMVYTAKYRERSNSHAWVSIRPATLPEVPSPPSVGSIVNCSSYTELINDRSLPWTVLQPGVSYSSTGEAHFIVPGNPDYVTFRKSGYSWYASDKYTEYVYPANLSVLNKTNDICKVLP